MYKVNKDGSVWGIGLIGMLILSYTITRSVEAVCRALAEQNIED